MAPGGYAWIFPKGEGKANVGLGVQADLWEETAAHAHKGLSYWRAGLPDALYRG